MVRAKKKSDKPQSSSPTSKRIKVQAQRKFAQGVPTIPVLPKESFPSTSTQEPTPRSPPLFNLNREKTYTEDFLTYLCFKGSNKNQSRVDFSCPYQVSRLFVPNGVRKQASESPTPAPALDHNRGTYQTSRKSTQPVKTSTDRVQTRSTLIQTIKRKRIRGRIANIKVVKRVNKMRLRQGKVIGPTTTKKALNSAKGLKTRSGNTNLTTKTSVKKMIPKKVKPVPKVTPTGQTVVRKTRPNIVRVASMVQKTSEAKTFSKNKQEFSSEDDVPLFKTLKSKKVKETPIFSVKLQKRADLNAASKSNILVRHDYIGKKATSCSCATEQTSPRRAERATRQRVSFNTEEIVMTPRITKRVTRQSKGETTNEIESVAFTSGTQNKPAKTLNKKSVAKKFKKVIEKEDVKSAPAASRRVTRQSIVQYNEADVASVASSGASKRVTRCTTIQENEVDQASVASSAASKRVTRWSTVQNNDVASVASSAASKIVTRRSTVQHKDVASVASTAASKIVTRRSTVQHNDVASVASTAASKIVTRRSTVQHNDVASVASSAASKRVSRRSTVQDNEVDVASVASSKRATRQTITLDMEVDVASVASSSKSITKSTKKQPEKMLKRKSQTDHDSETSSSKKVKVTIESGDGNDSTDRKRLTLDSAVGEKFYLISQPSISVTKLVKPATGKVKIGTTKYPANSTGESHFSLCGNSNISIKSNKCKRTHKSVDSDNKSESTSKSSKKSKGTRKSAPHVASDKSDDGSELLRKRIVKSDTNGVSVLETSGVSGVCTRTRSSKLKSTEVNVEIPTQKNGDDFTNSDEEPLASKISDTINKSSSTRVVNNAATTSQTVNEGALTPNTNTRLSILIDNETREMADRHSRAANTADSIDSSFNVNNGGIYTQTSSSSVDESGNLTVQPETEPPIENLRHVMKRSENIDNDRAQNNANEGKEDETLQHSLESYLKNNSEADRNKKFMKTREYIDNWIIDIAKSSSCALFLRWLMSASPDQCAEMAANNPQFARRCRAIANMEDIEDEDLDIDTLDTEEEAKDEISKKDDVVQTADEPPKPIIEQANTSVNMAPPRSVINKKKEENKTNMETQPCPVLSGEQSFDVYDFDSGSELSAHNASDEFGWKPKGMRDAQRPRRPIPSYSATRRNKMKQTLEKTSANHSLAKDSGAAKTPVPNNNAEASTSTSECKNNPGHMFFISLDGINKGGATVENMIGGVAVKVGAHEGPDQRVIMTAKLVTKSELDVTRESLVNQTGPVRDMVNSVLPQGFNNTFSPLNVTLAEPPPPVFDEMAYMVHALDSAVLASEMASSSRTAIGPQQPTNSPMRNSLHGNPGMNNNTAFPHVDDPSMMVEAPIFHPTGFDFQDPLEYIEKITPIASRFGICKIIPPASFQSECNVWEDMRFTPHNQYVHRMLHRWGPSSRQMCAIKKYLSTQGVTFNQPPKLSGIEVDLPKLYHVVQSLGGLKRVLEKKMWMRVAEEMCIPFNAHYMDFRLDEIYCKYLLPYDTLSHEERQKLFESVDKEWELRWGKLIARAANPMNCQEEEEDDVRDGAIDVTEDIEECVTRGKSTTLGSFARLAKNIISMQFGKTAEPTPDEVETKFWEYVTNRNSHICVNSGSIDSSVWGYGFPSAKSKGNNIAKHPWNLKVLTNNSGSVLRSLGPMVGVTAPTLHVGMAFSACCWYRDPHGLPWIEYLHQGAPKVWYGVPASQGQKFRSALASIVPGLCQQKTIWLLSDTAMVPPSLLTSNGVSLCRTLQQPGEFVIVFPKAFSSSICSGYSVSESVYFALHTWLQTAHQDFTDIRNSCEPSMFSLERLMVAISEDPRSSYQVLKQVLPALNKITQQEKQHRETLFNLGLKTSERAQLTLTGKKKMVKHQDEAEECQRCRTNLSLSMLYHTTENIAYCLIHGAEYLEANKDQIDNCKLIFMHSIEELQTIMSKLIQRINNLANKKTGKGK